MRKLLLNPTPLFRKLRQLSLLLTLLLALPQTAWGQDTNYGITIGGTPITSANKDDVLGDGKISFTPATDTNPTNTLTLREAGIGSATTSFEHGITVTNLANLTIICAGETGYYSYSKVYSTGTPIYCTDASCDLTFTSEENDINYIQFNTNATSLVEGFKTVTYVENKAEQFLPQKQIGFITYKINFNHSDAGGAPSLNTKTRTFDTTHLNSANFNVLSGGGFTFDPATCTLTILDGTRFGRLADAQLQQSAICAEIQWGVDADLRVVINGDCQIIGGVDGNFTYSPFRNFDTSTMAPHTGRKISFEKGAGATNVNLALVGADSLKSVLIRDFATTDVSLSSDLKWVSGLPLYNSASLTTNCDITVAGVPVTVAEGKGGITAGTGKIYFDGATKKMTMNGATVGGQIVSNLDELTIEFIGANSAYYISSTNANAPLTINALTDAQTTTSTLSLSTGTSSTSVVYGFASLDYSNGTYLQSDNACRYKTDVKAIRSLSDVNISTLSFTTTPYYPVWVKNQQVSSSNSGNVLDDGTVSYNAADHILTLDNATISNSNVIESELSDNLTIAFKGNNKLEVYTGNNSPIMSGYDTASLTFQKEGTGNCSIDIGFAGGVNLSSPIITNFSSVSYTGLNFASKTGTTLDGATTYDAVLTTATIYPLWVGGTLVTDNTTSGKDATSGNTVWEYNASSNTLTLTNYNKTDNDGPAFISNMANLNVYLVGNSIVKPTSSNTGKAFYTTYTDATLTFSTNENGMGTLDASDYWQFCEGFRDINGIYCNNGLGFFPSDGKIEAKKTPTISFKKRQQTGDNSPGDVTNVVVADTETLTTTYGSTFYAPKPTFNNGYIDLSDSTKYVYSYDINGIVKFAEDGSDYGNTGKIPYGELSLLKSGTVTITCTFPGNMQNNPCSASYTLQVNKADATLEYKVGTTAVTTSDGYVDVNGVGQWGDPSTSGGSAPVLTIPSGATAITYTSSDTNVATVNTTGTVTPVGPGQTTITATLKDDDCYNNATASYVLTVKVPATISFANATASVLNTGTYTQTATTVPAGATIEYSSDNSFVSVNTSTGEVTIANDAFGDPLFIPKATITAKVTAVPAANPQYYYVIDNNDAFKTSYVLNVSRAFNDITFESGQSYATFCNDRSYDLTLPEGIKAYAVKIPTSGNIVTLSEIGFIPGTSHTVKGNNPPNYIGVLLKRDDTSRTSFGTVTIDDNASGDPDSDLIFNTATVTTNGNQFILYKDEFVKATGTINVPCCYLEKPITNPNPARGFVIEGGGDGSTAINSTSLNDNEEMINDNWFDLQGRRIAKPTKAGLYIVNGKKVVINNK